MTVVIFLCIILRTRNADKLIAWPWLVEESQTVKGEYL